MSKGKEKRKESLGEMEKVMSKKAGIKRQKTENEGKRQKRSDKKKVISSIVSSDKKTYPNRKSTSPSLPFHLSHVLTPDTKAVE